MVNRLRTALSDKSVRAGTVLASWANVDGLVNEAEAIAFLADKGGARAQARADKKGGVDTEVSTENEPDAGEVAYTESDQDVMPATSSAADEPPSSDDDLYL